MSKGLRDAAHWLTSHAAKAYCASTVEDARRLCFALRDQGFGSTVCFWNDDRDTVEGITRSCLELIELLRNLDSHSYLSVKLPAMRFDRSAVSVILRASSGLPRLTHFDSHGPEDADRMFAVLESLRIENRNVGCTIPGRWLPSVEDARLAADWGLRVRVVKCQWPAPRQPDMRMLQGMLRVVDAVCGRASCVAVSSHDIPLAREAVERLRNAGTPCELELLHGLPRRSAVKMGQSLNVPIRFYVPQGKAWLPYLLKQAKKNPRVVCWFARDFLVGYALELRRHSPLSH